ncbi:hypothetical protein GP486_006934, partial [Trichoglossum hirsutum]
MPPTLTPPLLSPPELSYIHTSLQQHPPIRADGRTATQFRRLAAETEVLAGANGSARLCFPDGTEAVVGVKAEVERAEQEEEDDETRADPACVHLAVDIPGLRDDDALPVFLAAMLAEPLLASGDLAARLRINRRWHWKLYIDVGGPKL